MNIQKKQFDRKKAEKLKSIAYRSIEIINKLQQGQEDTQIMAALGCERQLVYYYIKKLRKE